MAKIVEYVTRFPGCTRYDLRKCGGGTAAKIQRGRDEAYERGLIDIRRDGRALRHYPVGQATSGLGGGLVL